MGEGEEGREPGEDRRSTSTSTGTGVCTRNSTDLNFDGTVTRCEFQRIRNNITEYLSQLMRIGNHLQAVPIRDAITIIEKFER